MSPRPTTFAAHFRTLPAPQRAALQRLLRLIKSVAPRAKEGTSYGMPALLLDGAPIASVVGAKRHCAFYPMSGSIVGRFRDELAAFDTSKGTIRFQPDRPLPAALVKKIVRARIAEAAARGR